MPTFPGSATRQSASPTGRSSPCGRSARRKTATTRAGCGSVERPAITSDATALGTREPVDQRRPLRVDQGLHRLEAGVEPGGDEVLALAGEETELLALAPRLELADELDPRVGRGGDHAGEA